MISVAFVDACSRRPGPLHHEGGPAETASGRAAPSTSATWKSACTFCATRTPRTRPAKRSRRSTLDVEQVWRSTMRRLFGAASPGTGSRTRARSLGDRQQLHAGGGDRPAEPAPAVLPEALDEHSRRRSAQRLMRQNELRALPTDEMVADGEGVRVVGSRTKGRRRAGHGIGRRPGRAPRRPPATGPGSRGW
jgi:hypothetical protein